MPDNRASFLPLSAPIEADSPQQPILILLPGVASLKPALVFAEVECWYFGRLPAYRVSTALWRLLSVTTGTCLVAEEFGGSGQFC